MNNQRWVYTPGGSQTPAEAARTPVNEIKRPTRWSYSSISTYKECPLKWKFSYIDNLPWPSSASMDRGTRMHKMAEDFVNGVVEVVPHEIYRIGPLLNQLRHTFKAKTEAVLMVDQNWQPTDDPDKAWCKTIIDVHYIYQDVLHVKDYKSGRMYDSHIEQLELYGIVGYCHYPDVKRIDTSAVYMDAGREGNEGSLLPAMIPKLIQKWDDDAKIMMADEEFIARPGKQKCAWCPYAKAKGGPCHVEPTA